MKNHELFTAIKKGNLEYVLQYLEKAQDSFKYEFNPNPTDNRNHPLEEMTTFRFNKGDDRYTALFAAACHNQIEIVRAFIAAGAKVNEANRDSYRFTPLIGLGVLQDYYNQDLAFDPALMYIELLRHRASPDISANCFFDWGTNAFELIFDLFEANPLLHSPKGGCVTQRNANAFTLGAWLSGRRSLLAKCLHYGGRFDPELLEEYLETKPSITQKMYEKIKTMAEELFFPTGKLAPSVEKCIALVKDTANSTTISHIRHTAGDDPCKMLLVQFKSFADKTEKSFAEIGERLDKVDGRLRSLECNTGAAIYME